MDKLAKTKYEKQSKGNDTAGADQLQEPSITEQVKQEFEYAEDRGGTERDQIENELSEPKYILPSPTNSREDVTFNNITSDQKGLAFGIANQRNEPLDMTEKIEERDEDRWALDPASAEAD